MADVDVHINALPELFALLHQLRDCERAVSDQARLTHWEAAGAAFVRRGQLIEQICDWVTIHDGMHEAER